MTEGGASRAERLGEAKQCSRQTARGRQDRRAHQRLVGKQKKSPKRSQRTTRAVTELSGGGEQTPQGKKWPRHLVLGHISSESRRAPGTK